MLKDQSTFFFLLSLIHAGSFGFICLDLQIPDTTAGEWRWIEFNHSTENDILKIQYQHIRLYSSLREQFSLVLLLNPGNPSESTATDQAKGQTKFSKRPPPGHQK